MHSSKPPTGTQSSRALSPAHRDDLHRSGLTDESIARLYFEAVPPRDLPVKGAESAYRIPYFDLTGIPNCFSRLKFVPPVTDARNHAMKYWQPTGSPPALYLPPLADWPRVATDPTVSLTITEGEKKAAAGCQQGLIVGGVGGVWCWTSTLDNGDKLVLPMLDEFHWTHRSVLLCPDSDAWHPGKETSILAGLFALAKELQSRGADVRFVVLPDLHGTKAGLDDWLLEPGNDVDHSWPKLERLALQDDRFGALTSWWQGWKEKHATRAAVQQHEDTDLSVTATAGLYSVHARKHSATLLFDRVADARGGVSAEVTVTLGSTELLSGVDLGLKSDTGQTKLTSSLKSIAPGIPWKWLLQKACSLVLRRYREGDPVRRLDIDFPTEPLTYSVNPLVFHRKTTILYGDGGLGKSTLALAIAMSVSVGHSVAGISGLKGRALYLDYEDDADVHARRLQAIIRGHPELAGASVLYQRCTEPLTKLTYPLVRRIAADRITFVVLDSLIAATGGESSAEATAKLFAALRILNVDILAIGHIPKTPTEAADRVHVYGSVFNQNFARMVWELRTEQEAGHDHAILGLFNRKSNLSRLHVPLGLRVTHDPQNTVVQYQPCDLTEAEDLAAALPLANRIRNLLEDGEPRSAKAIAEELGAKLVSVKSTLSRSAGTKWMILGGQGRETQWTVLSPRNESCN
jgi:hypothetical protein